jgi:pimeloyl-[acyl-carrier protein] synthase
MHPVRVRLMRRGKHNRHMAFGWASHLCFGVPLASLASLASLAGLERQLAFETLLRRMPNLRLSTESVTWQDNLGYRGLTSLPVAF